MLLQDSFEDDKAKILMILCASPDPKELHKTISTLEYGAKAECIVRAAHMPTSNKMTSDDATLLRSRITAMNQFIYKLQMDNKLKEKERDDAQKELLRREEELTQLRSKLKQVEGKGSVAAREEEINSKVDERTQMMRFELMKAEVMMLQQKEELSRLKKRLEELESDKSKAGKDALDDTDGGRFIKRLPEIYAGDHAMVVSMELDMGEHQPIQVVKEIKDDQHQCENIWNGSSNAHLSDGEDEVGAFMLRLPDNVCLSTVFEEDAEGEDRESTD